MSGLAVLSATEIARRLRAREVTAIEVVRDCLGQIERTDGKLHAWTCLTSDLALAEAESVDASIRAGTPVGRLAGVPLGVKDIFNTKDAPTQMGSPIWKGFTPGNDARTVFNLRQAGVILLGKTETAEFAVHQLRDGVHPHDSTRNPGTSSTGSAIAVASYQVPIAIGTQTAGSIVRPASYCGVYGFKPSFGLVPRTGMLKTTDSLDSIGYFARTVPDLRLVFDVIRVSGLDYPISNAALNDVARQKKPSGRRWRVAVVRPYTWELVHGYARDLFAGALGRWAGTASVDLVEKQLPGSTREAHEVHSTIYDKTLAYYFKEEFQKAQLVSPIFREIIEHGQTISLDQYKVALAKQLGMMSDIDKWFGDVDAVVTLSVAGEAPLREETERQDSCLIWTLLGLPAVSVPALAGPSGLPIGIQVVARRYNDPLLLELLQHLADSGLAPQAPFPAPRLG